MTIEKTLTSQPVYRGRVVSLRVDEVELPQGGTTKREIVEHAGAVVILAVDEKGQALLVRQFRKPVEKGLLELPAGGLEENESPDEAVLRELQEETGFTGRRVERLGGFYSSPGFCTEYLHAYLVTDLLPQKAQADEDESIEVIRAPMKDIPTMVLNGEICDAKSLATFWLAVLRQSGAVLADTGEA